MILQTECIKPSLLVLYAEVQPIFADFRSAKIVFIFDPPPALTGSVPHAAHCADSLR